MAANKKPEDYLSTVKGMHDLMQDRYYDIQGFFEKAQEIAEYYGFSPIETPALEHVEVFTKGVGEATDILAKEMYDLTTKGGDHLALRPEGTAPVMRAYIQHGMRSMPQPVMLYYGSPMFRHDKPQKGRYRQFHQFGLEIMGSEKAVVDALVICTTCNILRAAGAKDFVVEINSIGDQDSQKDYIKELKSYYRKFVNDLPPVDRERLKVNPLRILDSKEQATIEINQNAPDSINHLSNASKKHFKKVIEFLEEFSIDYRINKMLVRGLDYYSDTVFEVVEEVENDKGEKRSQAICGGGRYNYLATAMGHKKDIPGMGVGIGIERVIESPWWNYLRPRNAQPPKVYFVQFGFEARLKSMNVLEMLREAKIPVEQNLSKDRLAGQLAAAEKLGIRYVLIYGQKEAMDGTIIIKDMEERTQETVLLDKMTSTLKKLIK